MNKRLKRPYWILSLSDAALRQLRDEIERIPGINAKGTRLFGGLNSWPIARKIAQVSNGHLAWGRAPRPPKPWEEVQSLLLRNGEVSPQWVETDRLYPWQRTGTVLGECSDAVKFWWPTGSGKTLGLILAALTQPGRVLIITPAKARIQWGRAIRQFTNLDPWVLHPDSKYVRKGARSFEDWQSQNEAEGKRLVIVAGLEAIAHNLEVLEAFLPDCIGWDECHNLRGKKRNRREELPIVRTLEEAAAQEKAVTERGGTILTKGDDRFAIYPLKNRAKAAETLSRLAKRSIATTATHVYDRGSDLWAQCDLISPWEWGSFYPWAIRYCGGKQGLYGFEAKGKTNREELNERLSMIAYQVEYSETHRHLPKKTRESFYIPAEDLRRPLGGFKTRLKNAAKRGASALLWMQLAQTASQKHATALDLVADRWGKGKKFTLFTGIREDCAKLGERAIKKFGADNVRWSDGSISQKERAAQLEWYRGCSVEEGVDPEGPPRLLIGTWDAWGESIDGLQCTDLFVAVMLPISPGKLRQGEGRFTRGGQDRPCLMIYLVAEDTVDEHVVELLLPKFADVGDVRAGDAELADAADVLSGMDAIDEESFAENILDKIALAEME